MCSISGGADSDIMLDWTHACDYDKKVIYVFFDTGLEYKATRNHLAELEQKYNITVKKIKPVKSIPSCCREHGQPFISKEISQNIQMLQRHNFDFATDGWLEYEELLKKYPKIKSALRWWCNKKDKRFGISATRYLKEFMISNPPDFNISDKCCNYAKKLPAKREMKAGNYDLRCIGVRQREGGLRSMQYKNCFSLNENKDYDDLRPLFFITDEDKESYKIHNGIKYSDCYEVWGFKRTGCAGCPFNSRFEEDLEVLRQHEPNMHKACNNIFGKSYDYTRKYREFKGNYKKPT